MKTFESIKTTKSKWIFKLSFFIIFAHWRLILHMDISSLCKIKNIQPLNFTCCSFLRRSSKSEMIDSYLVLSLPSCFAFSSSSTKCEVVSLRRSSRARLSLVSLWLTSSCRARSSSVFFILESTDTFSNCIFCRACSSSSSLRYRKRSHHTSFQNKLQPAAKSVDLTVPKAMMCKTLSFPGCPGCLSLSVPGWKRLSSSINQHDKFWVSCQQATCYLDFNHHSQKVRNLATIKPDMKWSSWPNCMEIDLQLQLIMWKPIDQSECSSLIKYAQQSTNQNAAKICTAIDQSECSNLIKYEQQSTNQNAAFVLNMYRICSPSNLTQVCLKYTSWSKSSILTNKY